MVYQLAAWYPWVALTPPATFEIALLVRAGGRRPVVDRLLAVAADAARELGWVDGHAEAT